MTEPSFWQTTPRRSWRQRLRLRRQARRNARALAEYRYECYLHGGYDPRY